MKVVNVAQTTPKSRTNEPIPPQETNNDENPSSPIDDSMVAHKYDSWGPEGINFEHLLHFINETYYRYQERESHWYYQNYGPFLGVVALSSGGVPRLFLVQTSLEQRRHCQETLSQNAPPLSGRLGQLHHTRLSCHPRKASGSVPPFFQLDDYRGCNHHNYNLTLNSSSSSSSSIAFLS